MTTLESFRFFCTQSASAIIWTNNKLKIVMLLLGISLSVSGQSTLKGYVINTQGAKIAYAKMGIIGTNIMTVSDRSGAFELTLPEGKMKDSLTIQAPGYLTRNISIQNLLSIEFNEIILKENIRALSDVIVSDATEKRQTLGNKGPVIGSHRNSFNERYAVLIKPKAQNASLDKILFYVDNESLMTFQVRPLVYTAQNGTEGSQSLLPENRIVEVTAKKGWVTIDLEDLNIKIKDNILIGFEWLSNENANALKSIGLTLLGGAKSRKAKPIGDFSRYNGFGGYAIKAEISYPQKLKKR